MENNKEFQPTPDYQKNFNELPFGGRMKMPMNLLTPVTIDDYKESETEGPILVFKKGDINYIDDGCHRYYNKKQELLKQNNYQEPDLSKSFMDVIKVNPEEAINSWMLKY